MKSKLLLYASLIIIAFNSCSKDKSNISSAATSESIQTSLTTGSWRASNFKFQNQDHTSKLNGFVFTFDKAGPVTVANDLFAEGGSWSLTTHNTYLAVMFNIISQHSLEVFQEISGDFWDVTSHDNNTIEMRRTITDSPTTDYLTLKRVQ